MNEKMILDMIHPYLKENKLTYEEFNELFSILSLKEQYKVVEILNQKGLELIDSVNDVTIYEDKLPKSELESEESVKNKSCFDDFSCKDKNQENKIKMEFLKVRKNIAMSNETLIKLIQSGDLQAKQDLCIKNRSLVDKYASGYIKMAGNKLDFDDLEQSGMIGMLKAAEYFDFDVGTTFSTYATWWIKQAIGREIADTGFTIRIPVHKMEQILKTCRLEAKYMSVSDHNERIRLISEKTGYSIECVEENLKLYYQFLKTVSIDVPVGEDEETPLIDLLPISSEIMLEDIVMQHLCKEEIDNILDTLTKKEGEIIRMRFGLDNKESMTLDEIGKIYGVTRERIRQIEAKALRKLRHPIRGRKLKCYFEE